MVRVINSVLGEPVVAQILLEPQTALDVSEKFILGYGLPAVTVSCGGLAGDEIAIIEKYDAASETWLASGVTLTATKWWDDLWASAGIFRVNKPETVAEVGVTVEQITNIGEGQ